jgi:protein-tyrosine phosphatase
MKLCGEGPVMNRSSVNLLICVVVALAVIDPATAFAKPKQVTFVCTGNYYRSRFAEALFNQKAHAANLNWHASSRGLNLVPWQLGISHYTKEELLKRGVSKDFWSSTPKKLTRGDITASDCIILMDETEHRRVFEKNFPQSDDSKIQYWHIPDSGQLKPALACARMSTEIDQLLESLERNSK